MNTNLTFFCLLLTVTQNQNATTDPQETSCSDVFTISTLLGDCSVARVASIENNRVTSYTFEIDADTEILQTECVLSAVLLKNHLQGLTLPAVLNLSEQLFLAQRQNFQPLSDTDPELHKVIPLRILKSGLLTFLRQAN